MKAGGGAAQPVGSLDVALAHAARLLERDPALAAEQAGEILKNVPGHPGAQLILGVAQRNGGDAPAALAVLAPLAATQGAWAVAHLELGLTLGVLARGEEAVAALRCALALGPELPDAWRARAASSSPPALLVRATITPWRSIVRASPPPPCRRSSSCAPPSRLTPTTAVSRPRSWRASANMRARLTSTPRCCGATRTRRRSG